MESFAEFVIRLVELIEAEARALRLGFVRLGIGLTLVTLAGILAVGGIGLLMWAFYLCLADYLTPAGAACIVALCTLLIAGGLTWLAKRIAR